MGKIAVKTVGDSFSSDVLLWYSSNRETTDTSEVWGHFSSRSTPVQTKFDITNCPKKLTRKHSSRMRNARFPTTVTRCQHWWGSWGEQVWTGLQSWSPAANTSGTRPGGLYSEVQWPNASWIMATWDAIPCEQTAWQRWVKTSPSCNFIGGW